jgi:two-component system sensor histidine kinase/response regulator
LATTFIATAPWGRRGDRQRLAAAGFAALLTKPFKRGDLLTRLQTSLDRNRGVTPPAAAPAGAERRSVRRRRVLVADDNVVNQKVAIRVLEKLGFHADAVGNGREAIDALRMAPYDVVLMDVEMPEMDGLEASAAIRAGEARSGSHIPIVAMTAHAMKGDRGRCLEAGMDDYVSKPVLPAALLAAIERVCPDGAPEADASPPTRPTPP